MANQERLRQVLEAIRNDPDSWDQTQWKSFCGTKFCFAGHAVLLSRWYRTRYMPLFAIPDKANEWLELDNPHQRSLLFAANNSFDMLEYFVEHINEVKGFSSFDKVYNDAVDHAEAVKADQEAARMVAAMQMAAVDPPPVEETPEAKELQSV